MEQPKKKKKKKSSSNRTAVIFWICIILIAAPFLVLGWILISAALDTGTPILGDRYKGDLDPAITKTDLASVKSAVSGVSGVDGVDVQLATATLRVYADVSDSATVSDEKTIATSVYNAVTGVLNESVYFSQADGKKMYDMEIHVYNLADNRDSDSFAYIIQTKTSSMDTPVVNVVSEPIDAELAEDLRQAVENRKNPTPTPATEEGDGTTTLYGETMEEPTETATPGAEG